jgi:hypothetical protein
VPDQRPACSRYRGLAAVAETFPGFWEIELERDGQRALVRLRD